MKEEEYTFEGLVRTALRDEASRQRLPRDFARRLLCEVKSSESARAAGSSRWFKIAAALAAMMTFAAFAAWVGAKAIGSEGDKPAVEAAATTLQQGGNTMMMRKMATLVGAAMVMVAVPAAELTSEPTFVFLRPETSSFWNTATNSTMTLPIDFPPGATSASLVVSGDRYFKSYTNIVDDEFVLELPAPDSPETENVYDLTLVFDNNVTNTARLGLIQGLSPDATGMTRCLAPAGGSVWNRIGKRAVLPIPYGTTSFTIDGVETDTGLGGSQGWYALRGRNCHNYSLRLVADSVEYLASLVGCGSGFMLIVE